MSFETSWLTTTDELPAEVGERAEPLRAYLADEPTLDAARGLAAADLDGLIALAEVLESNQDGPRLALLRDAKLPRKARKAVGKAIHRLESRGVTVEATDTRVGTMGYHTEPLPSYLSVPMPDGAQLMMLSDRRYGQHVTVYAVTTPEGLEELAAIDEPSKSRLRRIVDDLTEGGRMGVEMFMEPVPQALVRQRLRAGVARHRDNGRAMPDDWTVLAEVIEQGDTHEGAHPIRDLLTADPDLVGRGPELLGGMCDHEGHGHAHYHPGPADRPVMTEDWQKQANERLKVAMDSPIVVDEVQRRQRVVDELDRLTEEVFDADKRAEVAGRLEETAWLLHLSGRQDLAELTLASADAVANTDRGALDVPWLRESIHGVVDVDAMLELHAAQKAHDAASELEW